MPHRATSDRVIPCSTVPRGTVLLRATWYFVSYGTVEYSVTVPWSTVLFVLRYCAWYFALHDTVMWGTVLCESALHGSSFSFVNHTSRNVTQHNSLRCTFSCIRDDKCLKNTPPKTESTVWSTAGHTNLQLLITSPQFNSKSSATA